MHAGDRSAEAIDAGQVIPGYSGVIVQDGYAGYGHLTDALHAWCGAHLLRDLKGLYGFESQKQEWASRMAALLIEARDAAAAASGQHAEGDVCPPVSDRPDCDSVPCDGARGCRGHAYGPFRRTQPI